MIKDIETLGLKIEDLSPSQNKSGVDLNSPITVVFNANINKATVVNNILLFRCDDDVEERVSCSISISENTVTLTPKALLLEKSNYKIRIPKNGISDILGRKLLLDFESLFITTTNKGYEKAKIEYPVNKIFFTLPYIEYTSPSNVNILEISNSKSFNLIVYSKLIESEANELTIHQMEVNLEDGLYYIRVKTDNNIVSDLTQFYLSSGEGRVSNEDYAVEVEDLGIDNNIELLEFKPSKEIENLNRKYIYYTFDGKIEIDTITKCKHYIFGSTIDESDESIVAHGYVDYNMIYMYDCYEQKTYLIFEIIKGEDNEEDTN